MAPWTQPEISERLGVVWLRLTCEECQDDSVNEARGWRGYLIDADEDGEDEAIFFCPICVEREFLPDSDGRRVGR